MKPHKSTKAQGDSFEAEALLALESLGFNVQRNLLLDGSQIDLLASRNLDIASQTFVVETKDHVSPIGVEAVRSFSSAVRAVQRAMPRAEGLFISSKGFTAEARAHAESVGILLFSYPELMQQTCDIQSLINFNIAEFERDFGVDAYIPLSCQIRESAAGTVYKPVERFLDDFLPSTTRYGCAILGNFGTGKTSLCKHYAYIVSQRWKPLDEYLIPIYIPLRDLTDLSDMSGSIFRLLRDRYAVSATLEGFVKSARHLRYLFLLDGLDEMAVKMDNTELQRNLIELQRFGLKNPTSKIVVTCRTHFFKTRIEEEHIPNFMRLYMCDWGQSELVDYVKSHSRANADDVIGIIKKTYNLEELARTPIFLKMITDTAANLKGVINQAKLYEAYTEQWIQSQAYRSSLSPDDKRNLMSALAHEMWSSDNLWISHNDLPKAIGGYFPNIDFVSLTAFDRDIRTCSFLVRDDTGNYRFVHKSYLEFFVGRKFAQQIKGNLTAEFGRREISTEIASFVACYFETDWRLLVMLIMGRSADFLCLNAIGVAAHLRPNAELQNTIELAISLHSSNRALMRRLIDCLALWKSQRSIEVLLTLTSKECLERAYAVRQLRGFLDVGVVIDKITAIIRDEADDDVVTAAIDVIVPDQARYFGNLILNRIRGDGWKHSKELDIALLSYVQNSADLELAMLCEAYLNTPRDHFVSDYARKAINELRQRYVSQIEHDVRQNFYDGKDRRENARIIRKKYQYLVEEEKLSGLLKFHYAKSSRIGRRATGRGKDIDWDPKE